MSARFIANVIKVNKPAKANLHRHFDHGHFAERRLFAAKLEDGKFSCKAT